MMEHRDEQIMVLFGKEQAADASERGHSGSNSENRDLRLPRGDYRIVLFFVVLFRFSLFCFVFFPLPFHPPFVSLITCQHFSFFLLFSSSYLVLTR